MSCYLKGNPWQKRQSMRDMNGGELAVILESSHAGKVICKVNSKTCVVLGSRAEGTEQQSDCFFAESNNLPVRILEPGEEIVVRYS